MLQPKLLAESILSSSGIVPRACSDVLTAIHQRRAQGVRAVLRISYVEIYGEQVCSAQTVSKNTTPAYLFAVDFMSYVSIYQHTSAYVSIRQRL